MTKLYTCILFIAVAASVSAQNNIGVGTPNPDPTSILDLTATDKGFLAPRLTTAQRNAIVNPATGLLVYDTNLGCYFLYNGAWVSLCAPPPPFCPTAASGYLPMFSSATAQCNSVVYQNGTNVGLNTTTPVLSFQDNATDAIGLPAGTTAQQPAGAPAGALRYNTTLGSVEFYNGTCWQNVNTPPIGATYIQWFNAADPNTLFPCTQWVASDIANGEFIRARGGASNVAAGASLTGTVQADEVQDHTHGFTGTIDSAGVLTTSSDGLHSHNWGGWWSNDNSQDFSTANGNGDGSSNTKSDNFFTWGGSAGTTTDYTNSATSVAGSHTHTGSTGSPNSSTGMWIPYDDNLSSDSQNGGFGNSSPTTCGSGWNGQPTAGNFMGQLTSSCLAHTHSIAADGDHSHNVAMYAHNHYIKERPTSIDGLHAHTVPNHTHTMTGTVGNMNSGNAGAETRPVNVAVVFWRRVN